MNSNNMNNSYFKSPQIKWENQQMSPIFSYPRINSTKMIIHNYQNVFEEKEPDSGADNDYDKPTPIYKRDTEGNVQQIPANPVQKLIITKSENLFSQLGQDSEFNITSSLKREDAGLKRYSMNNVTNIYINYTLNNKTKRQSENKRFNIFEIKIMKNKIRDYFPELANFNVELSEGVYAKDFEILNNKKVQFCDSESASDDENDPPKLKAMEIDNLNIQRNICLDELKEVIETIQETYNTTSKVEKESLSQAALYIEKINKITEKLKKSIVVVKKEPKAKKQKAKGFPCDYCTSEFSTGQALGGHMSRTHPNQSLKYNKKKRIRDEREVKRDLIYQARKELFLNHHLDYEELAKTKENKTLIKQIRRENMREYKDILDRLKKGYK
jgi:hypothetical protein